jgi:peptidyl-dipeptidase A
MLKLGSSVPWPEAMEKLTGQRKMDATAILQYFKPLQDWLEEQNYDERQGWSLGCPSADELQNNKKQTLSTDNNSKSSQNYLNFYLYIFCIFLYMKNLIF